MIPVEQPNVCPSAEAVRRQPPMRCPAPAPCVRTERPDTSEHGCVISLEVRETPAASNLILQCTVFRGGSSLLCSHPQSSGPASMLAPLPPRQGPPTVGTKSLAAKRGSARRH